MSFENELRQQKFNILLDDINILAKECIKNKCPLRVSIVSSLVGGTGSGIFIQTALLIRDYTSKHFTSLNVKIHGELILPSNFAFLFYNHTKMYFMEANAYAALKELNAINECFFNNASSIQLSYKFDGTDEKTVIDSLPYDYCFLYDKVNKGNCFNGEYIEDAIIERLFCSSSNALNNAFVNSLRSETRKRGGNLYGIISTEKIPKDSSMFDSEIFCSIMNRVSGSSGKKILMITSAERRSGYYKQQLPQGAIYIENINPTVSDTTITELTFGVEINEIEKLKYDCGQYHLSYKRLISQVPRFTTPHLDKRWHTELHDIGSDEKNMDVIEKNESFSQDSSTKMVTEHKSQAFISYSSQDKNIADNL